MTAGLGPGGTVLIHGGGSGIGTMAIQVAKQLGATVAVTASRPATLDRCRELGADIAIDYQQDDFVTALPAATGGRGADVILDVIGAKYLARNISTLADGGRLVIIGMQGGTKAELDINALMRRRAGVIGTTLRSRPTTGAGSTAEIVARVRAALWPLISAGAVRPVIDSVVDMPDAARAHRRVADGGHVGKVVLRVPAPGVRNDGQ
jgi:NADPH:quinone reductase-like Zn-dependent oxidoreductase